MKVTMLVLTIGVLFGSADDLHQDSTPASISAGEDSSSDEAAVRSTFLLRLRQLATRGNLFEPDPVGQILDMKLHAETNVAGPAPVACGDGIMTSMEVTTVTPSESSWFRELPSGAGHIDIPAFTINPATTSGAPEIEYRVYHSVHCSDWPRMRNHKEACLSFGGLPAFTCLTPSNIATEMPEIHQEMATDGVFILGFDGRVHDDAAVTINFIFRAGAACALSAEIEQDQEHGLRYRRALSKYEACRGPSDREFCSKHPNITWHDRELLRDMIRQAYERCGTVNGFYIKEPSTGESPPPTRSRHKRSPCDGV